MNTAQHFWSRHQGTQLQWCDLDSEERWHANMRNSEKRKLLELNGWDQLNAITYKFNSHGFRCQEFNLEPSMIALGCSFTGGVALPEDQIWPSLVASNLNLKLWNLGVGGASMDSCFRLLNHYISQLNVKLVCFLTPPMHRFELFLPTGDIEWAVPNHHNLSNYQKIWYQHDQNAIQNFNRNRLAIQHLCLIHNIKLIEKDSYSHILKIPSMVDSGQDSVDRARDLEHPGAIGHKLCSEMFLNSL